MIVRYHEARVEATSASTRRLRHLERRARLHADQLASSELTRWAAIRSELRARGKRLPEASDRRRWAR